MTPLSKDSLQIKFGEFFAETLYNSEGSFPYTLLVDYARKQGFENLKVVEAVKKYYKQSILWDGETFSLNPEWGFEGLLFEINSYRTKVKLDPILESDLEKRRGERI